MYPLTLAALNDDLIPIIAIVGGLFIATLSIVCGTIKNVARNKATEETKRELAAYVAEGSMKADEAERLVKAGRPKWECGQS